MVPRYLPEQQFFRRIDRCRGQGQRGHRHPRAEQFDGRVERPYQLHWERFDNGITVQSGSTLEIRVRRFKRATTAGGGVDIVDSQAIIFGYPESQGSMLTAHNNGGDGIFVANRKPELFWRGLRWHR